jgi:hypothetical protein
VSQPLWRSLAPAQGYHVRKARDSRSREVRIATPDSSGILLPFAV